LGVEGNSVTPPPPPPQEEEEGLLQAGGRRGPVLARLNSNFRTGRAYKSSPKNIFRGAIKLV
jgi:hypothetical protein